MPHVKAGRGGAPVTPAGAPAGRCALSGSSTGAQLPLDPVAVGDGGEAVGVVVHYVRSESAVRSAIAWSSMDLKSESHSRQSATNAS